jgi:hypothetical protein
MKCCAALEHQLALVQLQLGGSLTTLLQIQNYATPLLCLSLVTQQMQLLIRLILLQLLTIKFSAALVRPLGLVQLR